MNAQKTRTVGDDLLLYVTKYFKTG